MIGSNSGRPPFRAEHVGSFVRPARLLDAARANKAGALDDRAYVDIQNECIGEIVAFQDELGMPSITDGEFRRRVWSGGLTEALDGLGLKQEGILSFHSESEEYGVPPSPYAEGRLSRRRPIVTGDYEFLAALRPNGMPKVTIASPAVLHFWLGDGSFNPAVYNDRDAFFRRRHRHLPGRIRGAQRRRLPLRPAGRHRAALQLRRDGKGGCRGARRGSRRTDRGLRPAHQRLRCRKERRHIRRPAHVPGQFEGHVDGRRRLRTHRRAAVQRPRCRRVLHGV